MLQLKYFIILPSIHRLPSPAQDQMLKIVEQNIPALGASCIRANTRGIFLPTHMTSKMSCHNNVGKSAESGGLYITRFCSSDPIYLMGQMTR